MTHSPAPTPAGGVSNARPARGARRGTTNYAARRMLVSSVVITLVVASGVAAWQLTRDDTEEATAASGGWDQVVLVDRATGALASLDSEGAVGTQQPAVGRVTAMYSGGNRVALVGNTQIVLVGLDDSAPVPIAIEAGSTVVRLPIDDALWLAVGSAAGGNVTLIDGLTGTTLDIGELAGQSQPRYFLETIRSDPEGTEFAVADVANFQTVVVRPDATAATFLADQPLALGGGYVVTSQVVGQQADVALFDSERTRQTTVPIGLPVSAVFDGDEVVVVTVDGVVYRFGGDDEEAERVGAVTVPAGASIRSVQPTESGDRLVVFGDVFETVIDLSGKTVFTTTFAAAVDAPTIEPGWRCLAVGGGSFFHSLISLETGEQLADLTGVAVTGASADGCVVIGKRGQISEVISADGVVPLGQVRSATLAPDGRAVVTQATTGPVELTPIEDGKLGEPVDISGHASASPIVTFLSK